MLDAYKNIPCEFSLFLYLRFPGKLFYEIYLIQGTFSTFSVSLCKSCYGNTVNSYLVTRISILGFSAAFSRSLSCLQGPKSHNDVAI